MSTCVRAGFFLVIAALVTACVTTVVHSRQEVDVSPLTDLRLRDDIDSIAPAFPDWQAIARDGVHVASGEPMWDDILDDFTLGDSIFGPFGARVTLYRTPVAARQAYWEETALEGREGAGRLRGVGNDRVWIGEIREIAPSPEARLGLIPRGPPRYRSSIIFLKGRVVVAISETSRETKARKGAWVRDIADRLARFAVRDPDGLGEAGHLGAIHADGDQIGRSDQRVRVIRSAAEWYSGGPYGRS